jgi:hypothetical protein
MISFRDFTICFSTCEGFSLTVRLYHKVHIYLEYIPQCVSPRWNWDSPTPSAASKCDLPPGTKGGEAHSPAGEVVGSPNSDDLRKILALCLLCRLYRRTITNPDIISQHWRPLIHRCGIHTINNWTAKWCYHHVLSRYVAASCKLYIAFAVQNPF